MVSAEMEVEVVVVLVLVLVLVGCVVAGWVVLEVEPPVVEPPLAGAVVDIAAMMYSILV